MLNSVNLIGNLGNDPDIRYMPSGDPVANVSLATTEKWKDKQSGETKEHTEWHRLVMNNANAKNAEKYLKKGTMIYVSGKLRTRKWTKDGVDHYSTEVHVEKFKILKQPTEGSGKAIPSGNDKGSSDNHKPSGSTGGASTQKPEFEEFSDDIPFLHMYEWGPGERKMMRCHRGR